jgi:hypothetical protein
MTIYFQNQLNGFTSSSEDVQVTAIYVLHFHILKLFPPFFKQNEPHRSIYYQFFVTEERIKADDLPQS